MTCKKHSGDLVSACWNEFCPLWEIVQVRELSYEKSKSAYFSCIIVFLHGKWSATIKKNILYKVMLAYNIAIRKNLWTYLMKSSVFIKIRDNSIVLRFTSLRVIIMHRKSFIFNILSIKYNFTLIFGTISDAFQIKGVLGWMLYDLLNIEFCKQSNGGDISNTSHKSCNLLSPTGYISRQSLFNHSVGSLQ